MFQHIHRFINCRKLESLISELEVSGKITDQILKNYKIYHFSLLQKLKSAYYFLDRLEIILESTPGDILETTSEFMFEVNLCIDGYFYNCGSALDILAREVLTYFGETLPDTVYFRTGREMLRNNRPNDPILNKLEDPPWKEEFSKYRNALTHEIIMATSFSINVQSSGDAQKTTIILPLPDDPRIEPEARTYDRNPDVLYYMEKNFKRLISLINQIYGEIYERGKNTGRLPL